MMVITMTAGTAMIMWLGELITDRGIGNGMSIMIFTSVISSFPAALWGIQQRARLGLFAIVIGDRPGHHRRGHLHRAGAAPDPGSVRPPDGRPEDVRRHVDVHPAQGQPGRRHPGHLRQQPALPAGARLPVQPELGVVVAWVQQHLVRGDHPYYMITYFALIIFFTYFYVAITFNPDEVADNMKKYGGFVPGIRAGQPTEDYLAYVLSRITFPGAIYLGLVALVPLIAFVRSTPTRTSPSAARRC